MSKAEEIHYKAVIAADNQEPPKDYCISTHADHFNGFVEGFIEGYHQAEKELELTLADIEKICLISREVHKYYGFWSDIVYQEILKRFKDYKEGKDRNCGN